MDTRPCPYCGHPNPPASRFCGGCGRPVAAEPTAAESDPWIIGRYSGLRFQIDPADPPPYRDARWVLLVLGVALAVAGGLFLILDSVISGAFYFGGAVCGGSCGSVSFTDLFLYSGLGLLLAGIVLAAVALLVRRPARSI